jgi:hypothetical protein
LAVPSLCELYPGICLTTEEKVRKTLVRVAEEIQRMHIIKTPTHYKPTHTHTNTYTLQNSLKPPQYKLKQTQYKIYPNEIITI